MPRSSSALGSAQAPAWVRRLWDLPWFWLAVIVPFFCVPLFVGLDGTDLENDEAIYSFAVETMLKDGDWLTPKTIPSETSPFLEKPPLKFWITYLPMRAGLLPQNEFGLRFMDALIGSLAFLYVFGIGRRLAGPVCGLVAVLLLFGHDPLLFAHGLRSNNMESSVVLAYAAGVYHFLAWRSINPDLKRHIYAMSFWFVFGFMTKFVAALFLPAVLGLAALVKREDRERLYRDWPALAQSAILAIALIAPWFVYQYFERGQQMLDVIFGEQVVQRFTAHVDPTHLQPWHFYFTQMWQSAGGEGTRLLVAVAVALFVARVWLKRWIEGLVIVLWFVGPMVAISTGTSKLYHYAYPFLAPIALAAGWLVAAVARRVYEWLERPVRALTNRRDAVLPQRMVTSRLPAAFTSGGLAFLLVAAVTAAFGRIQFAIGPFAVRNSSAVRPALAGLLALVLLAPHEVWRAVIVGAATTVILPHPTDSIRIRERQQPHRQLHPVRACLEPIVANRVALGRGLPGTLAVPSVQSWVPVYYLRTFGRWDRSGATSDAQIISALAGSTDPRFVLVSKRRYWDLARGLATNGAPILDEAARLTNVDSATIRGSLERGAIGLAEFQEDLLILPGPYADCGHDRVRLISSGADH